MNNVLINKHANKLRQSTEDRVFNFVTVLLGFLIVLVIAYPLYFVIIASFSKPEDVLMGRVVVWPKNFSIASYEMVLNEPKIWIGYRNSLMYAVLGTCINLILTTLAAYPLSRKDMPCRTFLTFAISFTMMFSGGMIPTYLVIRDLKMLDSIWAMVIPNAIATYNLLVMKNYFQSNIPQELQEAAQIDGCSDFKLLIGVVLPLSTSIIAVIILFYAVEHWNAFFNAVIYLRNRNLFPLQLFLREILLQNQEIAIGDSAGLYEKMMQVETMKYAIIIVSSLPVLLLYPFVQKHFVTGIMVGAVKG
jgi:ABC-type sugar transport system, permease component